MVCWCVPALWLVGCTERIDIDTRDAVPRLVVYGCLTSTPMQHEIRITRSTGYFADAAPEGVPGAEVIISGGGQTFTLHADAGEPGLYRTDPQVFGLPGTEYTLDVALDVHGDGKITHYRATSLMPPQASLDEIVLQPADRMPDYMEILISAVLPEGGGHYYSLHVWREDQALTGSLSRLTLFSDSDFLTNRISRVPCYYLDQREEGARMSKGNRVTVALNVIPKEYFDFLIDGRAEAGGSVPFFSGPPANLSTNIRAADPADDTPLAGFFSACATGFRSVVYE